MKYSIPFNQIISTGNAHALTDKLKNVELEMFQKNPFWKESIELELDSAFLRISRLSRLSNYENDLGPREKDHLAKFRKIRTLLNESYSKNWTSAQLARMGGLSVNRFNALYRKFFHISPVDDLIHFRLEKAKALLMTGGYSVGETAEKCGFSSLYYFSRIFKKRIGCSPKAFVTRH